MSTFVHYNTPINQFLLVVQKTLTEQDYYKMSPKKVRRGARTTLSQLVLFNLLQGLANIPENISNLSLRLEQLPGESYCTVNINM